MKEAENSISEEANIAIGRNTNSRYLEKFSKKNFTIAGIRTRDYSVASQTSYQPSHRDTRLFASAFPLHLRLDVFDRFFANIPKYTFHILDDLSHQPHFSHLHSWPATGGGPIYADWT